MTTRIADHESRLLGLFASLLPLSLVACSKDPPTPAAIEDRAGLDAGASPDGRVVDACAPTLPQVIWGIVDGGEECLAMQRYACGTPAGIRPIDGGCTFTLADCQQLCPALGAVRCWVEEASCDPATLASGPVDVSCDFCFGGIGRRPGGLVPRERAPLPGLGRHFAEMAHLEAASVLAFVELRRALTAFGAPSELVDAASSALVDERRHARHAARLARLFGGRAPAVRVAARSTPSLERLATENAVEGCVRETYGALVAWWASGRSTDPSIAATMREIAEDETRHAALSHAIHAWLMARLSPEGRARAEAAQRDALAALSRHVPEPTPDVARVAGVPRGDEHRRLVEAFQRAAARGA